MHGAPKSNIAVSAEHYTYVLKIINDLIGQKGFNATGTRGPTLAGLPPCGPNGRIDFKYFFDLFETAVNSVNDRHFGLHVGEKFRVAGFESSKGFLAFCKDIEQAVSLACRYSCLVHNLGRPFLQGTHETDSETAKFVWEPSFNTSGEPISRHIVECVITNYVMYLNGLSCAFGKVVKCVTFQHKATCDEAEYVRVLGCNVVFGSAQNTIILHQGILNKTLPTTDKLKLTVMRAELERALVVYKGSDDLILRIEQKIYEVIQHEKPTMSTIASELAIGERTLRRRLKTRNVKFSDMLSGIQKDMCSSFVQEGRTYAEIAYLLWYADQSAFTRAFKRWYGTAPTKL